MPVPTSVEPAQVTEPAPNVHQIELEILRLRQNGDFYKAGILIQFLSWLTWTLGSVEQPQRIVVRNVTGNKGGFESSVEFPSTIEEATRYVRERTLMGRTQLGGTFQISEGPVYGMASSAGFVKATNTDGYVVIFTGHPQPGGRNPMVRLSLSLDDIRRVLVYNEIVFQSLPGKLPDLHISRRGVVNLFEQTVGLSFRWHGDLRPFAVIPWTQAWEVHIPFEYNPLKSGDYAALAPSGWDGVRPLTQRELARAGAALHELTPNVNEMGQLILWYIAEKMQQPGSARPEEMNAITRTLVLEGGRAVQTMIQYIFNRTKNGRYDGVEPDYYSMISAAVNFQKIFPSMSQTLGIFPMLRKQP